jgi:phosphate transport system permease protein
MSTPGPNSDVPVPMASPSGNPPVRVPPASTATGQPPGQPLAGGFVGRRRDVAGSIFHALCLGATLFGIIVLGVLFGAVAWQAWGWLDGQFLISYDDSKPAKAGILAGLWGSLWLMLLTGLFSVPVGVGAAVYLEEYAKGTWLTRLIQLNIANLAGVPSIVYGILGVTVFVRNLGVFGTQQHALEMVLLGTKLTIPFPLGVTVLSGALTLSLLVLPTVIIATQEALRSVPPSIRHGSYALGATKWQTIWHQVLPAAIPGILTGVILALSRAIGEAAPLLMIGIPTFIASVPGGIDSPADLVRNPAAILQVPFDSGSAMPLIIFNWVTLPQRDFRHVAAAGIMVLVIVLLTFNTVAILIRQRFQKRIRW